MEKLAAVLVAFLLAAMWPGGSECAALCDSRGLTGVQPCFLDIATRSLPDSPAPACCVGELPRGEQYVSGRRRPETGRVSIPFAAASPTLPGGAGHRGPLPDGSDALPLSGPTGLQPLYVLHSVFLI